MIPGDKVFHTKDLSHQLGIARLSFGSADRMAELLDVHPGSVSVLALMNDPDPVSYTHLAGQRGRPQRSLPVLRLRGLRQLLPGVPGGVSHHPAAVRPVPERDAGLLTARVFSLL